MKMFNKMIIKKLLIFYLKTHHKLDYMLYMYILK